MFKYNLNLVNHFRFIYHFSRRYAMDRPENYNNLIEIIVERLEISTVVAENIIKTVPLLKYVEPRALFSSIDWLYSKGLTANDLMKYPVVLTLHTLTLENRWSLLLETGFTKLNTFALVKIIHILNQSVEKLKFNQMIPEDLNVYERLETIFVQPNELPVVSTFDDKKKLWEVRKAILNAFLIRTFEISDLQLDKMWKSYPRIKQRSFTLLLDALNNLRNDLHFPNSKIVSNLYILTACSGNIRRIVNEIHSLGSMEIHDALLKYPKLCMVNFESLHEIKTLLHSLNIPNRSIDKCLQIFTLGPATIQNRLKNIKSYRELEPFINNPQILKLILYEKKASRRVDYLNEHKLKTAPLYILSGDSTIFNRYMNDDIKVCKASDIIHFLANLLQQSEDDIRIKIQKHQHWSCIPLANIKETCDFLLKRFNRNAVADNIQLVLYPKQRIEERLTFIQFEIIDGITQSQRLSMCLYLIERDYHFTGDGVWLTNLSVTDDAPHMGVPALHNICHGRTEYLENEYANI